MSLESTIRDILLNNAKALSSDYTLEDIYRSFQQQAFLMHETARMQAALDADPFEQLKACHPAIERFQKLSRVTSCHRVQTSNMYSRAAACVRIKADVDMQKFGGVQSHVDLTFHYEREGQCQCHSIDKSPSSAPSRVWYSIDLARDFGPTEKLLWCQVYASGSTPSPLPPVNIDIDEEDDDDWSDCDGENDESGKDCSSQDSISNIKSEPGPAKRQRPNGNDEMSGADGANPESSVNHDDNTENEPDRYYAGMDPDVLARFLQWTQLGKTTKSLDQVKCLFMILTLPYYESEWDIVGMVLSATFGEEDDDES